MNSFVPSSRSAALSDNDWLKILGKYKKPSASRSAYELGVTAIPFFFLWAITAVAISFGYWVALVFVVPAAGFLLRLFIVQHDCGHGSFFGRRRLDDWIGRAIGVLTLTPYDYWRLGHAVHHACAGNLDERGMGDVTTLTVTEYFELSPVRRKLYELYRNPFVMFVLGPAFLFIFKQRLPFGMMRSGIIPWMSTMSTNLIVAALATLMIWNIGFIPLIVIHLPIVILAGSAGIWLFYVQHQFEETHWSRPPEWKFPHAALHGASHYELPQPLKWFTGNIGIHHLHHLSSRVPFYRLPEVIDDYPELASIGRISLSESFACVKLVLWDEGSQRLISLGEAKRRTSPH